jgi:hypothetical protein
MHHQRSAALSVFPLFASFTGLVACATAPTTPAKVEAPPGVTYEGGDGLDCARRVVIKGGDSQTGIAAEYAWLAAHYPGSKRRGQTLDECDGKQADRLDITTAEGKQVSIYFDITDFFGKGLGL